ncbi:MAG: hypothetical protein KDD82_12090 [Planctomycetes bacterium]|nr:hypothetical protein [Planctomycetota bacterium]
MTHPSAGNPPSGGLPNRPHASAGVSDPSQLTLEQIQEYVWSRYVNHDAPAAALDEDQALEFFEAHYATRPMATDADCYYYGILAFERSFANPAQQGPLLERALEAFRAYRHQASTDSAWEAVEDRYEEILSVLGIAPEAAL